MAASSLVRLALFALFTLSQSATIPRAKRSAESGIAPSRLDEPACIYTSHQPAVYCAIPLEALDPSIDISTLPTVEDPGADWKELTSEVLASLRAKNFGYYCTSKGSLATTKKYTEEGCDLCVCIDLYPKSPCVMGITGMAYCARNVHDESLPAKLRSRLEEGTPVWAFGDLQTLTTDLVMRIQPDPKNGVLGVNDMALVCMDDRKVTRQCQSSDFQYYCTDRGKVAHNGHFSEGMCDEHCVCINLAPKPNYAFWLTGGVSCQRKRGTLDITPASIDTNA